MKLIRFLLLLSPFFFLACTPDKESNNPDSDMNEGPDSEESGGKDFREDLSYLRLCEVIHEYETGYTIKTVNSYDGNKPIASKQYMDNVLIYSVVREFSGLSYSEVTKQYDSMTGKLINTTYGQGRYLDDTYLRLHEVTYEYDTGYTIKTVNSYDEKKLVASKQYMDDVLVYSVVREFSGLSYSEVTKQYDSMTGKLINTTYGQGRYLDDTYLRLHEVISEYDTGYTVKTVNSYDEKKLVASKQYMDNVLIYSVAREFSGLSYSEVTKQYDSMTGKLISNAYGTGKYMN